MRTTFRFESMEGKNRVVSEIKRVHPTVEVREESPLIISIDNEWGDLDRVYDDVIFGFSTAGELVSYGGSGKWTLNGGPTGEGMDETVYEGALTPDVGVCECWWCRGSTYFPVTHEDAVKRLRAIVEDDRPHGLMATHPETRARAVQTVLHEAQHMYDCHEVVALMEGAGVKPHAMVDESGVAAVMEALGVDRKQAWHRLALAGYGVPDPAPHQS